MDLLNVQYSLLQLNRLTREMITLLDGDEAVDTEALHERMKQRKRHIRQMSNSSGDVTKPGNPVKRAALESLFSDFEELSEQLKSALETAADHSRVELATATRHRKAEQEYHLLNKPDISYY